MTGLLWGGRTLTERDVEQGILRYRQRFGGFPNVIRYRGTPSPFAEEYVTMTLVDGVKHWLGCKLIEDHTVQAGHVFIGREDAV